MAQSCVCCSKRLHGSPVTERTNIRCERPFATCPPHFICLPGAARWDVLFSRRRHADSHVALCRDGGGRFFFSTGPHSALEPQSTSEAAHAETEAVAEDGRCCICMRARCVVMEHLAGRRKSPVWSTEATYLPGSTAGVPEKRSAALIYTGAPV
jgi:hypothetical protein